MLKEGETAPDFELVDSNGKKIMLSSFRGKKVVLYFYPKDDTPGCTKEACNFRDDFSKYKNKNIEIIGISFDNQNSHSRFAQKYKLPFTLLSDTRKDVSKKYEAIKNKGILGIGIKRTTYLIDEKGKILKVFAKVDPETHSKEILAQK